MEFIDETPYGMQRSKNFNRFLDEIKKGEMPLATGWEFTYEENSQIRKAIDSLKDKPGYNEDAWYRYYIRNIEYRVR